MVAVVRDEQVARAVHRHASGTVQLRAGGRPAITGEARRAITRHRGDDPVRGDLADAVVAGSAMNRLPAPSTATPPGESSCALSGRPAVSGKAAGVAAIARHRGNDPAGETLRMRLPSRDEQVARAVHRHATRTVQLCAGGRPAITQVRSPATRHRGDDPAGETLRMRLANVLRDEEVARTVHRHAPRLDLRAGGRPAITRLAPPPATVVMIPSGETLRTTSKSAMNRLPAPSTATPVTWFNAALVAGPPSPE